MTAISPLKITLKIPMGRAYGIQRFFTLVFDHGTDVDICAIVENEWRTNGAKYAPFHSGAYTQPRTAQTAPFSTPNGARMSFEAWVPPAPLPKNEAVKEPKTTPREDLLKAREIISEKASEMALLDERLYPVREEERRLRNEVLETHGERNGVIILNLDRAGERAALFERLTEISLEWGPVKTERGNLNRQIKALERDVVHLEKIIAAVDRKKRKA